MNHVNTCPSSVKNRIERLRDHEDNFTHSLALSSYSHITMTHTNTHTHEHTPVTATEW